MTVTAKVLILLVIRERKRKIK